GHDSRVCAEPVSYFPSHTSRTHVHVLGPRSRPSYHRNIALENERAQGMPGEGLTHGPRAVKRARGRNHRFSRIIRHSLRDGFTSYNALSLGTGLSCSHRSQDHLANLASASGGQDHTPLTSANATFVQRGIRDHRSPASRVVTIAIRPLHRGGM